MEPHVHRAPDNGRVVTMRLGLLGESYEEPEFLAVVHDHRNRHVGTVTNASLLCLASGTVRAPDATDAQILESVLNDGSIYSEEINTTMQPEVRHPVEESGH